MTQSQFSAVTCDVRHEDFSSPEALGQRLRGQKGQGWILLPSQVSRWDGGDWPKGPILAAEIAQGEHSLHIRPWGGGWRMWIYSDKHEGDDRCLDESFLSTEGSNQLLYRVYWKLAPGDDGIQVYRPYAARFLGWGD